ncbi:hypothetical protein C27AD_14045 [Salinisphaera hydrothermalis C27AD]
MKDTEGVFKYGSPTDAARATFDPESTADAIEVLRGEQTKLNELDLVLAVVGTMKAGKSTTINAIVGKEVLPNRNRPMTALPTLIRHTPGRQKPVLIFDNNQPINDLLGKLRSALDEIGSTEASQLVSEDQDMSALADYVKTHEQFGRKYEGTEKIFLFLKQLNDLVRLASHLDVDFPFPDYDEVHELPVIEVEFSYLSDSETNAGRLTLLDTPGPNEAGQRHLKRMLREQLSRASAVMAVLDYTQLKSDADDQVRQELLSIADMSAGRLYALVNKFDQQDRHSDTEEQVCTYISETLLERKVPKDAVFAVSALHAYLANQMLSELSRDASLNIHSPNGQWIHDFADLAFGAMWDQEDLQDAGRVRNRAEKLWKKSLFSNPLEQVIKSAHAGAALLAVQSAADKVVNYAEQLNNFFGARASGLLKDSADLKEQVKELKADIDSVSEAEKRIKRQLDTALSEVDGAMQEQSDQSHKELKDAVNMLFESGKGAERQEIELEKKSVAKDKPRLRPTIARDSSKASHRTKRKNGRSGGGSSPRRKKSISSFFLEELHNNNGQERSLDERIFDPNNPLIELKNKEEAENIKRDLEDVLAGLMLAAEGRIHADIDGAVADFDKKASQTASYALGNIKDRINERLAKANFDIALRVPRLPSIRLELGQRDVLSDMIKDEQKTVEKSRVKSGWWSGLKNWFHDDWGRETYSDTETVFRIDMDRVRKQIEASVDAMFDQYRSRLSNQLKKPLEREIRRFFGEFKAAIGAVRADLQHSLDDKRKTQDEQDELHRRLMELKKNVPPLLMDGQGLRRDVRERIH